jgi:hypothetical protein
LERSHNWQRQIISCRDLRSAFASRFIDILDAKA